MHISRRAERLGQDLQISRVVFSQRELSLRVASAGPILSERSDGKVNLQDVREGIKAEIQEGINCRRGLLVWNGTEAMSHYQYRNGENELTTSPHLVRAS